MTYEDEAVTTPHPLTRLLQRWTQRTRAFDRRHPLAWDVLVTGVFVVAALTDATGGGWRRTAADPEVARGLVLLLSLALSVPLLWRRRHPLAALAVMTAATATSNWTGAWLQAALIQFIVVFNIALRLPPRTLGRAAAMTALPITVCVFAYPRDSWDELIVPQIWSFAVVALAGITVRSRQDHTQALVDRAHRLEVERDQQAQLATAAERNRMAREMHDIIGHHLSVITGLADGGSYAAAKSPERAAQALEAIGTTSRQALSELRRLLDVLRDDTPGAADRSPQPALTDLDGLIDGVRAAGLPVRSTVHGRPDSVPAGRQLTVYRVVQEALTNTLKHGGPDATATVDVSCTETAVTVQVTDTGTGGSSPPGSGRGLTGMRERTSLYDGTLEAGPLPAPRGGWRVRLHLPTDSLPENSETP
ncbi:sensor histidine kinase [Streptomyces sp. G44]|uniref:sensor histidine kinase n=1 Tax=Streptomyces sp. G44 TaxID=2807632 RepID=UPI0019601E6C|nr:sensor histidine kinase [Streptomyces sp. G44]MBM7171384.1 sensor histidine kinase [Streptomyces sp. G44]